MRASAGRYSRTRRVSQSALQQAGQKPLSARCYDRFGSDRLRLHAGDGKRKRLPHARATPLFPAEKKLIAHGNASLRLAALKTGTRFIILSISSSATLSLRRSYVAVLLRQRTHAQQRDIGRGRAACGSGGAIVARLMFSSHTGFILVQIASYYGTP